jgi:hypothetical protein
MLSQQLNLQSIPETGHQHILPRRRTAEMTSSYRVGPSRAHPANVVPGSTKPTQHSMGHSLGQMQASISRNHHPANLLFRKILSYRPSKQNPAADIGDFESCSKSNAHSSAEQKPLNQDSAINKKMKSVEKAAICENSALSTCPRLKLKSPPELLTETFKHTRLKSLEKYLASVRPKRVLGNLLQKLAQTSLETLSASQLFRLMTDTKLSAAAFQMFFYQKFELSPVLTELVVTLVPQLLLDKLGCHVLRRVSLASDRLMRVICELTISLFRIYSINEHSSRVMQTLAAVQPNYAAACLSLICSSWKVLAEEVSIYYLLYTCLKHVDNHVEAFQRVGLHLYSQISDLFEYKHLKKIICIYLEFCKLSEVHRFYQDLDFESAFRRKHQDRHMANILRVLVQVRALPAAIGFLEELSKTGDFLPETIDKYFFNRKIVDRNYHIDEKRGVFAVATVEGDATLQRLPGVHLLTNQRLSPRTPSGQLSRKDQDSQLPPFGDALFQTYP